MGRRLVFFPLPFVGHQNPTFDLASILYSRGFSISVIHTHFHSPNPAKYPNFNFHFIEDGLSETELRSENVIVLVDLLNKNCVESFNACLSRILTDCSDQEPVACLIADSLWHCSQGVADALNVPRIVLLAGNLSSFTVFFAGLDVRDKQPDDFIMELPHLKIKDILTVGKGDQSPIHELLANMVKQTKVSKGIIFNAIEEFESESLAIIQQEFSIPIFSIGPFHKWLSSSCNTNLSTQDQSPLLWLDTQKPNSVLYVSFGSLAAVDQAGFIEMANGLANSNQPFLWVIRSDLVQSSNGSSQFPDGFLGKVAGRGHFVGWASQKEVLAHPSVGGFWTHNGWNSTVESICEGVPMICSPSFGDQMVNSRYVSDVWKIGLQLEKDAKAEDFEKAIRTLMAEKEGDEIRGRALCLKIKAIDCLNHGGSSYKNMESLVNLIMSF